MSSEMRKPWRTRSLARCAVDFEVHRSSDIGCPGSRVDQLVEGFEQAGLDLRQRLGPGAGFTQPGRGLDAGLDLGLGLDHCCGSCPTLSPLRSCRHLPGISAIAPTTTRRWRSVEMGPPSAEESREPLPGDLHMVALLRANYSAATLRCRMP